MKLDDFIIRSGMPFLFSGRAFVITFTINDKLLTAKSVPLYTKKKIWTLRITYWKQLVIHP